MKWQQGDILRERYCLLQRLGSYSNRQTWLAFDAQSDQRVTLKAILFAPDEQLWQEQRLIEREAQTLASISHPAIPRFYEQFELTESEGTYTCLVLEYIPGKSLTQIVRKEGVLSLERVKQLVIEVLTILKVLHSFAPPIIHRDLKPDNLILREADGQVCLVDFGSIQAQFTEGRTTTVVGTYGYMAPEQFAGFSSFASDLYGLGVSVLFALNGQDPSDWPRRGPYIDLRTVPDEILRIWLAKMLDPDPTCRFADAMSALSALLQPMAQGKDQDLETFHTSNVDLRISLSPDRYRVDLTSAQSWRFSYSFAAPIISLLIISLGLYLPLFDLTNPRLLLIAVLMALAATLMLASAIQNIPWQWQLVAHPKNKLLLRTLFGKVINCYTLPASLQVAIAEENIVSNIPTKFSVALVTPQGKRYLLGNWYNKLEARQLARFLREWLAKNN